MSLVTFGKPRYISLSGIPYVSLSLGKASNHIPSTSYRSSPQLGIPEGQEPIFSNPHKRSRVCSQGWVVIYRKCAASEKFADGGERRKGRNEIAIPGSGLLQKERRAATSAAQAFQQYQIRLYGKSRCEERFVMVFYIILHWGMKRSPTRAPTRLT
ncbi:UNVERIFIED_CONTAM: hypothetical protein Slati_4568700 [Sesamum latifolium]|uniref:Uncharacterized protein n=1 Tax=Sesamum latifolium TaxID=2727402 RepID=A0AAW2SH54_9LAMI